MAPDCSGSLIQPVDTGHRGAEAIAEGPDPCQRIGPIGRHQTGERAKPRLTSPQPPEPPRLRFNSTAGAGHLLGGQAGRQHHFEHLDVFAVAQLTVVDAGRLVRAMVPARLA